MAHAIEPYSRADRAGPESQYRPAGMACHRPSCVTLPLLPPSGPRHTAWDEAESSPTGAVVWSAALRPWSGPRITQGWRGGLGAGSAAGHQAALSAGLRQPLIVSAACRGASRQKPR